MADDKTPMISEPAAAPDDRTPVVPPPAPKQKQRPRWVRTVLLVIGGILVAAFIGIQLIPVDRTNPPVATQIKWDSPQTEALAKRACMDCHSNETVWPAYSYVAPISWLVHYDVVRGRSEWNFSTLGQQGQGGFGPRGPSGDLAYQLGAMLAGERSFGGRGGDRRPPDGGQFPPRDGGQNPGGGQFPPRDGGFGGEGGGLAGRVTEQIQNKTMPPANYTMLHPDAILTDAERQQLIDGLKATLASIQGN